MRDFTRLYLGLDATTATSAKLALLEAYFREADPADAAWVVVLIAGERPKGVASSRALKDLVIEWTGWPAWLVGACREAVGDLSETVALLVESHLAAQEPDAETKDPIHEPLAAFMQTRVLALAGASDERKQTIIGETWRTLSTDERLVYHKLLRGGFRVGVQKKLLTRAIAAAFDLDASLVAQRLTGRLDPTPSFFAELVSQEPTARDNAVWPYPFLLAYPVQDAAESFAQQFGEVGAWQVEWKWDGIRAQLIKRGDEIALWSRGDEVITHQFPEIVHAARGLGDIVLDGEVLVWQGTQPRPFAELQTRLNRVTPPPAQLGLFGEPVHAVFLAYDVLESARSDVRTQPLHARRAILETQMGMLDAAASTVLRLSEVLHADTWAAFAAMREDATRRGTEGLMLKHRDSVYGLGRTKGEQQETNPSGAAWWKWKVDPYTVDAVLVASQLGTGRRASLFTDHTFGLWGQNEAGDRELVTFAKAYSGLSNEEIERLDSWVRRHTTGRAGPVRFVQPEHVFEIAFEGVRASGRHKAGLAVRFPRIQKWRTDKGPEEADTLATLRAMLPQALTEREA